MYKDKKILAIIPVREGSKRLPEKNYRILNGKPLIEWTIFAAKNSKYIDEIVISSDDSKILEIARTNKVIDYKRNKELSSDMASSVDVIIDVIDNFENQFDLVVVLQPTSPLRQSGDIDSAIDLFYNKNADSVVSVCESDHPVQWMNTLPKDLSMNDFLSEEVKSLRSQDLEKFYRPNGALYLIKPQILITKRSFYIDKNAYAFVMPRERSIDIDEKMDFIIGEILIKNLGASFQV